jgi:hypothetical protein
MLTFKTILLHHEQKPAFFKVPLFRLLREEEQLMMFRSWFTTIATDASMLGGGGFCYEGQYAGHFFRVPFPAWVIRDIRESMKKGHGDEGSWRYTIAVAEKAMHTLGLILYGEPGGCCAMLQDNQNVVDWVLKGWGKPTRVQNYLRWDVMVAQSRDMWAAIEYIHTSLNIHADLLSRSFNEDGSLTLYVGPTPPADGPEGNWIPSPPQNFAMTLRLYLPQEQVMTGRWKPPITTRLS